MKKILSGLAAVAIAAAGLVASATAAQAHDATAELSCEGWSASAWAYPADAHGVVIADGVTIHDGTFGGAGSLSGTWPEVTDSHRLQVTITSPDGWPDYVVDETVTGCAPVVEEPPVVVPQVQDFVGACDAAFVLDNLGSTLPVIYTINGTRWLVEAGTAVHTDADGTRIAPIDGGYFITTDTGREWFFPEGVCPPVPPTEEPPVVTEPPTEPEEPVVTPEPSEPVETPAPEPTPTPEGELIPPASDELPEETPTYSAPAPTANPQAQERQAAPATLPQTGFEVAPVVIFGAFVLLLVGLGFLVQAIRRSR